MVRFSGSTKLELVMLLALPSRVSQKALQGACTGYDYWRSEYTHDHSVIGEEGKYLVFVPFSFIRFLDFNYSKY